MNYLDYLLMVCMYGPNNFYLESSQIYSPVVCYILHYLGTPLLKKNNIEKIGHVSGQYPGHLLDLLQILGMINEAYHFNDLWPFSTVYDMK